MPEAGPVPWWARVAEPVYALGSGLFHAVYDRGWRHPRSLPRPVISVGNLAVGGTGKTPAVRGLAAAAVAAGLRPAILTRGYGGRRQGVVVRGGLLEGRPAGAAEVGDEPLWLSRILPEVPVAVGRNRFREGQRLLERDPVDVFLLDDGFQHRRLARDRNLVLLDRARPFGNGRLLPAGPLREPPRALARADAIVLVESPGTGGAAFPDGALPVRGDAAVYPARWRLAGFRTLAGTPAPLPPAADLWLVSGIARPRRFRGLLEDAGYRVLGHAVYGDHHRFETEEIRREEFRARHPGTTLVTTTKDGVRLEGRVDPDAGWLLAEVELEVEGGWGALLDRLLGRGRSPGA